MSEHEIFISIGAFAGTYLAVDFFWKIGVQARLKEIERKLEKVK